MNHQNQKGLNLPHKKFPIISVTEHAYSLISDLEQAYCNLAAVSPEDREAVKDAYSALCHRRKELYEYLETLEKNAPVERPVKLRFE